MEDWEILLVRPSWGVSCYAVRTRTKVVGKLVFHTDPSVQGCPATPHH